MQYCPTSSFPGDHPKPIGPRRKFTSEEDLKIRTLVERLGTKSWDEISRFMPGRTARQCRDRYKNYLLDSLVTAPWTPEEDAIVIQRYRELGPRWVEIAKTLSGRSGNHVKNRWHRHLARQGGAESRRISNEPSTESEDEVEKEVPTLLLCPVLQFRQGDWSQLFDRMEVTLGYDSAWRAEN
jgi:hypothetical protein